ncbi:MAG: hypothetical protein GY909_15425 [Oligoflexia bacterium]|nr:hypothetical protein [Oligoflexia bacterium]
MSILDGRFSARIFKIESRDLNKDELILFLEGLEKKSIKGTSQTEAIHVCSIKDVNKSVLNFYEDNDCKIIMGQIVRQYKSFNKKKHDPIYKQFLKETLEALHLNCEKDLPKDELSELKAYARTKYYQQADIKEQYFEFFIDLKNNLFVISAKAKVEMINFIAHEILIKIEPWNPFKASSYYHLCENLDLSLNDFQKSFIFWCFAKSLDEDFQIYNRGRIEFSSNKKKYGVKGDLSELFKEVVVFEDLILTKVSLTHCKGSPFDFCIKLGENALYDLVFKITSDNADLKIKEANLWIIFVRKSIEKLVDQFLFSYSKNAFDFSAPQKILDSIKYEKDSL